MKPLLKHALIPGIVFVTLIILGGCTSVMEGVSRTTGIVDRTEARINQAAMDAVGIGALEDAALASLIYTQVFFAGGYGAGYGDFAEGEGVAWDVTFSDAEDSETIRIERALLKDNADGTGWWLLRYSADGEDEFLSEALIDGDYQLLAFRYMDPETDTIREWIPEEVEGDEMTSSDEDDAEDEGDGPDEMAAVGFYDGSYEEYLVGTESVRVPAGTYQADHILIEDTYIVEEEGGETASYQVRYEWWISREVPGELVRYIWANTSDDTSLSGELVSHRMGYTTQLASF
jgi:uncharacterized protein YceK